MPFRFRLLLPDEESLSGNDARAQIFQVRQQESKGIEHSVYRKTVPDAFMYGQVAHTLLLWSRTGTQNPHDAHSYRASILNAAFSRSLAFPHRLE